MSKDEGSEHSSSWSPASVGGFWRYAIIALGIAGLFWRSSPLVPTRPAEATPGSSSTPAGKVRAQSSEDPLEAVRRHLEKASAHGDAEFDDTELDRLREALSTPAQLSAAPAQTVHPVCLLAVTVPGDNSAAARETRLRTRFALAMALDAVGYRARDGESLSFLTAPWVDADAINQIVTPHQVAALNPWELEFDRTVTVPFEWYVRDDLRHSLAAHESVCVLWLDANRFADHALARMAQLVDFLSPFTPSFPIQWIGPCTSSDLRSLLEDFPARASPTPEAFALAGRTWLHVPTVLTNLTIFSTSATISDTLLAFNPATSNAPVPGPAAGRRRWVADEIEKRLPRASKAPTRFVNLIASDDDLCRFLAGELLLRGIDVRSDRIAIVAEQDTEYGRALSLTFGAEVARLKAAPLPADIERAPTWHQPRLLGTNVLSAWDQDSVRTAFEEKMHALLKRPRDLPENLRFYSYPRGLDGMASSQGSDRDASARSSNADEFGAESPEGLHQLDYLRRMARRIVDENRRALDPTNSIQAIGIFGSDEYDRLLILQAIRAEFPDVTCFTTDLDYRMFHSSRARWSRNLIVASSYGVELPDQIRDVVANVAGNNRSVVPFRDSYQTAQFLGVLAAVHPQFRSGLALPPPLLFEVGLRGPKKLTAPRTIESIGDRIDAIWHPIETAGFSGSLKLALLLAQRYWFATLVAIVTLVVFCMFWSLGGLKLTRSSRWSAYWTLLITALASVGWFILPDPFEPRVWYEGVSIYPSQFVYATTLWLAGIMILLGAANLRRMRIPIILNSSEITPASRPFMGTLGLTLIYSTILACLFTVILFSTPIPYRGVRLVEHRLTIWTAVASVTMFVVLAAHFLARWPNLAASFKRLRYQITWDEWRHFHERSLTNLAELCRELQMHVDWHQSAFQAATLLQSRTDLDHWTNLCGALDEDTRQLRAQLTEQLAALSRSTTSQTMVVDEKSSNRWTTEQNKLLKNSLATAAVVLDLTRKLTDQSRDRATQILSQVSFGQPATTAPPAVLPALDAQIKEWLATPALAGNNGAVLTQVLESAQDHLRVLRAEAAAINSDNLVVKRFWIFGPYLLILLLAVARNEWFDQWSQAPILLTIPATLIAILVYSSFRVRNGAQSLTATTESLARAVPNPDASTLAALEECRGMANSIATDLNAAVGSRSVMLGLVGLILGAGTINVVEHWPDIIKALQP